MTEAAEALIETDAKMPPGDVEAQEDEWVAAEGASASQWQMRVPRRSAFQRIPRSVYPIWRINNHELQRPVVVSVESSEVEVIVDSADLRIWGSGQDVYEALRDFLGTFATIIDSYVHAPEEGMTRDALRYRDLLRSYYYGA
jgi:hypothetical protein